MISIFAFATSVWTNMRTVEILRSGALHIARPVAIANDKVCLFIAYYCSQNHLAHSQNTLLLSYLGVSCIQSFAYDGKTVIVAATLSDIKKAEQGKGDMDSNKLVRIPSKVGDLSVCVFAWMRHDMA